MLGAQDIDHEEGGDHYDSKDDYGNPQSALS